MVTGAGAHAPPLVGVDMITRIDAMAMTAGGFAESVFTIAWPTGEFGGMGHRINHSVLFATGKNHINGIENFWNQAKRVLRKYNGIPKALTVICCVATSKATVAATRSFRELSHWQRETLLCTLAANFQSTLNCRVRQ